jgi:hypothetical protein
MHHSAYSRRLHFTILLAALLIGGCTGMPTPPPEVALITLTKVNSDRVVLRNVCFEQRNGRLFLRGHVYRHYPAAYDDTSKTHLTITFLGAGAECLLALPAAFAPGKIPRWARMPGFSVFSVPLDRLPLGTQCILIRAYDDSATSPTPQPGEPAL